MALFVLIHAKLLQFSSVAQSCLTLCNPMNHSTQASLSITISRSSLRLTSIESVMPSNGLILCRPILLMPSVFSSIRVFSNESALHQSIGVSASASLLPVNIQDWFPLGLTDLISLLSKWKCHASLSMEFFRQKYWRWVAIPFSRISSQPRARTQVSRVAGGFFTVWATREALLSKEFSRVFSNTTVWKPQFFSAQLSL